MGVVIELIQQLYVTVLCWIKEAGNRKNFSPPDYFHCVLEILTEDCYLVKKNKKKTSIDCYLPLEKKKLELYFMSFLFTISQKCKSMQEAVILFYRLLHQLTLC